jgi:hypothetical protein
MLFKCSEPLCQLSPKFQVACIGSLYGFGSKDFCVCCISGIHHPNDPSPSSLIKSDTASVHEIFGSSLEGSILSYE